MKRGFTIVELLIVVVVIAILAVISVVAYNGIQDRATNTARYNEIKAWEKQFKLYAAQYGEYPQVGGGAYCLGEGFPDTNNDGLGECRDTMAASTRFSVSTALNAELSKVGTLPSGPRTSPGNSALGPFVSYSSPSAITLGHIFKASTCPSGMSLSYQYSSTVIWCRIAISL